MQFTKNTSKGKPNSITGLLLKVLAVIFLLFLTVILLDKIDSPIPNKKIQKVIPNENFKTIK